MNHNDNFQPLPILSTLALCPCCGKNFQGSLAVGCPACGAQAVGEPLAPLAAPLPSFARPMLIFFGGTVTAGVFIVAVIINLWTRATTEAVTATAFDFGRIGFSDFNYALQTAAWSLKYSWLPLALIGSLVAFKSYRHVVKHASRFVALKFARYGLIMMTLSLVVAITAIAASIPERLHQRELAAQARTEAVLYGAAAVLLEYQNRYGTLPGDLNELRKLPDPDGRVARTLASFTETESYAPSSSLQASVKAKPSRGKSVTRLRPVNFNSNLAPSNVEAVTFTNYALTYAGRDGVLGTADDITLRDGLLLSAKPAVIAAPSPHGVQP